MHGHMRISTYTRVDLARPLDDDCVLNSRAHVCRETQRRPRSTSAVYLFLSSPSQPIHVSRLRVSLGKGPVAGSLFVGICWEEEDTKARQRGQFTVLDTHSTAPRHRHIYSQTQSFLAMRSSMSGGEKTSPCGQVSRQSKPRGGGPDKSKISENLHAPGPTR